MSALSKVTKNSSFGSVAKHRGVSISNAGDVVRVELDLPGFNKKDIKISGSNGYLNIEAKNESLENSFQLLVGEDVSIETARASVSNGVLTVALAKISPKNV